MKKFKGLISVLLATMLFLGGCGANLEPVDIKELKQNPTKDTSVSLVNEGVRLDFDYEIDPETFEVTMIHNEERLPASQPLPKRVVQDLIEKEEGMSWIYPEEQIKVEVGPKEDYLEVKITALETKDQQFVWPKVAGESYILPLREGKFIPNEDAYWKSYLDEERFDLIEAFSMRFFGVNQGSYSILYVMDDLYHSQMAFDAKETIGFEVAHDYKEMNPDKTYGFRIYVTPQNPVDMTKIYKSNLIEAGEFKTLEEKARTNPEIEKLYGASHMYLWDSYGISEENIDWKALQKAGDSPVISWIKTLLKDLEDGEEAIKVMDDMMDQDYVDQYQKNMICKAITAVITLPNFYDPQVFTTENAEIKKLLEVGVEQLNELERIELNKHLLQANLPGVFDAVENWADTRGVDILKEMRSEGIDRAWIGMDNWMQGVMKPELVSYAVEGGYLIGPYDSYHSIHEPGKEKWHTAVFTDTTLYDRATVQKANGDYEKGFKGVGRKLNPTLSMDAVKERVESILAMGIPFNSWFVDCDATGEIYDDYTPAHPTTAQEDLKARLDRMTYISEEKNMVVGSEGGNDFASTTIALAHGLELPSFSWMDEDMKENKESDYYIGKYYSAKGGVPDHFAKQIPVKETYKKIFLDEAYTLPLFKLVYNESVITTYHWDWSTFKMIDEVPKRMLYEILYNVPPLYHIDKWEWEKYKEQIISHSKMYQDFSQKAIVQEMTDFQVLSEDRLVQMTKYGDNLKVIANFSDEPYVYEGNTMESCSLIIIEGGEVTHYKP